MQLYVGDHFVCRSERKSFLSDLHTKRSRHRVTYTRGCIDKIDSPDNERSERKSSYPTSTRNGRRHRVTYTRDCIDTVDSPDYEHGVARNT